MRAAWSGALRAEPAQLVRAALAGFKANWRAGRRQRAVTAGALAAWRAATRRNATVRALAQRIKEVSRQLRGGCVPCRRLGGRRGPSAVGACGWPMLGFLGVAFFAGADLAALRGR
jgi:hypothetical protein